MNIASVFEQLELLSIREQGLVGATVVAFLVSILQFFVVDPLLEEQDRMSSQLSAIESRIQRQERQLTGNTLNPMFTKQSLLEAEIAELEKLLEGDQSDIKQYASSLVPAKQMPELLQALLEEGSLVSLVNLPPVALIETPAEQTNPEFQLYRHGIRLELRGNFHALRRYLQGVEKQSRKLLWEAIRLETDETGSSLMEVKLQTLSMDNAWLGV